MTLTYTVQDIDTIASTILENLKHRVVFFEASMGAGKTTLISSLCKQLEIIGEVSSPTFSVINEYQGKNYLIYHMDLYRINSKRELVEIGFEDYLLQENAYFFIEWPELAKPYFDHFHLVNIDIINPNERVLKLR